MNALKTPSGIILLLVISVCSVGQQLPKQTPFGRGYLEYKGCESNCPVIIFLHGAGERGDGSIAQLNRVKANGLPKVLNNGSTFPFIILSPQQSINKWNWTGDVIPFIKWAIKNYPIDSTRVFVTGLSMGDTWSTLGGSDNNPNYIRASVPVSGKGEYNAGIEARKKGIQVWAWHGDKDGVNSVQDGKRPLLGMGLTTSPEPLFTVVPGGGHNSVTWDYVYKPDSPIYQWFLSFRSLLSDPEPKDPIVEQWYENGNLYNKTKSGKILRVFQERIN